MVRNRQWKVRTLAVLAGLSVFVLFEGVCRLAGWGVDEQATMAFAEVASVRPLFEAQDPGQMKTAGNRHPFFAEDFFTAIKPARGFRVFVFGGSTVQGRPYSIPTSFPTFLKLALQTLEPDRAWEVVNCGGISYASYRLLPIMQECLQYEPDLYIVCTGHNEFLECVTYAQIRESPELVKRSYGMLQGFNSFHLLANLMQPRSANLPAVTFPAEVDALLDHQGGIEAYRRDSLHAADVVQGFRTNLLRMTDMTQAAGVPLLFVHPPSNLRDCPPFKSEFSAKTSEVDRQSILAGLQKAREQNGGEAIATLADVASNDPHFAITWYQLGHALLTERRRDEAATAFTRARDEDICPLRMTSDLEMQLRDVAMTTATPILNTGDLLAQNTTDNIIGDAVLADHVHPSFHGNQMIALALLKMMGDEGLVSRAADGQVAAVGTVFDDHLQSLDNLYFLRGRRTLKSLQEWTKGRADGPPLEKFLPTGESQQISD